MRRRRAIRPLIRLAIAMGVAERNIGSEMFRRAAAHDAQTIPKESSEIGGGRKGEMARAGRALMARLPTLTSDQFDDAAVQLRGYADAISSDFVQVSETKLGERRRRTC